MPLKKGSPCPIFSLKNSEGKEIHISYYIGKTNLVIYFYPKDETTTCTLQACIFRNVHEEFSALNAEIFGISNDSVEEHRLFSKKYKLNFHLLSDEKKEVKKMFKVTSSLLGLIPKRVTFVVDLQGRIAGSYSELLNADHHIEFARETLKKLN